MTTIIACISQKGGVGKSTLSRAIACEAWKSGLSVKLADLDTQQGTCVDWHRLRLDNGYKPIGSVEVFRSASEAIAGAQNFDLLVLDGAPRASKGTLETALHADLVILPTCASRDDLVPAVKLAYSLEGRKIDKQKITFALVRVTTPAEIKDARDYISQSGFSVLDGCLFEKPAYRLAQNNGLSVTETQYKTLNDKANKLLESIIEHLQG